MNLIYNNVLTNLSKAAVEYIEGTVIAVVAHVVHKVFHLHLHRISIVVLATLEPLVAVFLAESLNTAIRHRKHVILNSTKYRVVLQYLQSFKTFPELLRPIL